MDFGNAGLINDSDRRRDFRLLGIVFAQILTQTLSLVATHVSSITFEDEARRICSESQYTSVLNRLLSGSEVANEEIRDTFMVI